MDEMMGYHIKCPQLPVEWNIRKIFGNVNRKLIKLWFHVFIKCICNVFFVVVKVERESGRVGLEAIDESGDWRYWVMLMGWWKWERDVIWDSRKIDIFEGWSSFVTKIYWFDLWQIYSIYVFIYFRLLFHDEKLWQILTLINTHLHINLKNINLT